MDEMSDTKAESWEFAEPINCTCGHRASIHNIIDGCTGHNCGCTKDYQRAFDVGKISQLTAQVSEMREALNSARELLETAQRNNDCARNRPSWRVNSIFAKRIDKWLAKYPGGEK
jgi:hypothetical protein